MAVESATELLDDLNATLDALTSVDLTPADVTEALALTRATEMVGRRVRALQVGLVGRIEESRVYRTDGHRSAAQLVGYAGKLDSREAKRRAKAGRALDQLPVVRAGFEAGLIGADQVDRIARTFANPRVQERFVDLDMEIAALAMRLSYDEFDARLTNWEAQADEDGTADRSRANHDNRDAQDAQDYDGGWRGHHRCGSLQGAQMHSIHAAAIEAEFQADWEEARAIHGDATTVAHLSRTDAQRRMDALHRIYLLAANAFAAAPGGAPINLNILFDCESLERHLLRLVGVKPAPRKNLHLDPEFDFDGSDATDGSSESDESGDSAESGEGADQGDVAWRGPGFRCSTSDGHFIDPTEAAAASLVEHVRRVVLGADSVVIDLSRRSRLFTGSAQMAAMFSSTHCVWPGCRVPASHCQIDHTKSWRSGGSTNPGNGAPCCGHHNRLKEHGFTFRRDKRGRMHVYRPNGSEIE